MEISGRSREEFNCIFSVEQIFQSKIVYLCFQLNYLYSIERGMFVYSAYFSSSTQQQYDSNPAKAFHLDPIHL